MKQLHYPLDWLRKPRDAWFASSVRDLAVVALTLSAFDSILLAQRPPSIVWQHAYGGTEQEMARSIVQTRDSGFIVGGYSRSGDSDVTGNHGLADFWVMKLDAAGNLVWQKSFGGSQDDFCFGIDQTTDDGCVAVGITQSNDKDVTNNHGVNDIWVVKLDVAGRMVWQHALGGSGDDQAASVKATPDGGCVVAGWTTSTNGDVTDFRFAQENYWVVKLDRLGNIMWEKSYGGNDLDFAKSISLTADGGYIVAGRSNSADGNVNNHIGTKSRADYWVVKLSSQGILQWEKSLGGTNDDFAQSVIQTRDHGYAVVGESYSSDHDVTLHHAPSQGFSDYWLVRLDSLGRIKWQKSLGGSDADVGTGVRESRDGTLLVGGFTYSNDGDVTGQHGDTDFWVCRVDALGRLIWQRALGGSSFEDEWGLCETPQGAVVVAGSSHSGDGDVVGVHGGLDDWIVKLDFIPIIQSYYSATIPTFLCVDSQQVTLQLYNVGSAPLIIDSATFIGNAQRYAVAFPRALPDSVRPDDSILVVVTLNSFTAGTFPATLLVFSNDSVPGRRPWRVEVNGHRDIARADLIGISSIDFGDVSCGTTRDTIGTLFNHSTIPTYFTLRSPDPDFVISPSGVKFNANEETIPLTIHFAGTTVPGRHASYLIIGDTCGRSDSIPITISVDSLTLEYTARHDTVVCSGTSIAHRTTIHNRSNFPQRLSFTGGSAPFTVAPSSLQLAAGDSADVTITFPGTPTAGIYSTTYDIADNCGSGHLITLSVTVDDPAVVVVADADTAICPGDPATRRLSVYNLSNIPEHVQYTETDPQVTVVPSIVDIGASDSVHMRVDIQPSAMDGLHVIHFDIVDACGGRHDFTMNVNVRHVPPVTIRVDVDTAPTPIGVQRKAYVVAEPHASLVSGGIEFVVESQFSALGIDSISMSAGIVAMTQLNATQFSVVDGRTFASDTIATVYYSTFVGATLEPWIIVRSSSGSPCVDVTTAPGTALYLLPPGCELGTVIWHPFTTQLQSISPNPVTGSTMIAFSTAESSRVKIEVHDILGRVCTTVLDGSLMPGEYSAPLSMRGLPTGRYSVVMSSGGNIEMRPMIIER